MAEYIDRVAVEKFIEDGLNNPDVTKRFGHDAIEIMAEIHYMPVADVAPVVRCKDCKYYREGRVLAPNKFCFRLNHPTEPGKIGNNFADDDFCSHGVRRNEGGQ